jgi:uncharacterized protein
MNYTEINKNKASSKLSDDDLSRQLKDFGLPGIIAFLLILLTGNITVSNVVIPVGAVLILIWVRLSNTPWKEIGYMRPKSWIITVVAGIVFGAMFKLVMKSAVMPLFHADPVNRSYHYLAGNTSLLPYAVWAMLVAGFAEETVFRGYLFERLQKLLKIKKGKTFLIVLLTSVLFGLAHYTSQGMTGVEQATVTGLVFGAMYSYTKEIWTVMIIHAAFDLTALAIIYWDVEENVAHWVFN